MSQFISLEQAVAMTTLYRNENEKILAPEFQGQNILCRSETFDREVFDSLLSKPDCKYIRVYYGMDDELKVHAIVVAADSNNRDILPPKGVGLPGDGDIGENARRCPDDCPQKSDLNP